MFFLLLLLPAQRWTAASSSRRQKHKIYLSQARPTADRPAASTLHTALAPPRERWRASRRRRGIDGCRMDGRTWGATRPRIDKRPYCCAGTRKDASDLLARDPWTDRVLRYSDILHPSRANISKEELREKLGALYKAQKEQVQVFGLRTQFGGGKTTGFALVYDSPEALKKFEPNYRLVRVGLATKAERASRQQRTFSSLLSALYSGWLLANTLDMGPRRRRQQNFGCFRRLLTRMAMQASNARTDRRPSVEQPRSRVPSRRRTNKRIATALFLYCKGRFGDRIGAVGFGQHSAYDDDLLAFSRHEGLVDEPLEIFLILWGAGGDERPGFGFHGLVTFNTSMKSTVFSASGPNSVCPACGAS